MERGRAEKGRGEEDKGERVTLGEPVIGWEKGTKGG